MRPRRTFPSLQSLGLAAALALAFAPSLNGQAASDAARLIGKWTGTTDMGSLVLEFRSATQLVFEDEVASYRLLPGIIRVQDEEGTTDYRYALRGEVLVVSFPEGFQIEFTRSGAPAKAAPSTGGGAAPGGSNVAASPQVGAGEAGDSGWGFKFRPPAGWKFQKNPESILLGHDAVAGLILVLPHTAKSLQNVREQMLQGLHEEGVDLSPAGNLRPSGSSAYAGDFEGLVQGTQAKALGLGTLSPFGGGAFIVAVTTPEKFGREISAAAEAIAQNLKYFRVEPSGLMSRLAGTWVTMTKSTETRVTLTAGGEFFEGYESSYSGRFDGGGGWGTANNRSDRGRWSARGDERQGQITLTYQNGRQVQIQYRVHIERGETYWNEYWFNGDLYGRQKR